MEIGQTLICPIPRFSNTSIFSTIQLLTMRMNSLLRQGCRKTRWGRSENLSLVEFAALNSLERLHQPTTESLATDRDDHLRAMSILKEAAGTIFRIL